MFTIEELQVIFNALIQRPYVETAALVSKVQAIAQTLQAQKEAPTETPAAPV